MFIERSFIEKKIGACVLGDINLARIVESYIYEDVKETLGDNEYACYTRRYTDKHGIEKVFKYINTKPVLIKESSYKYDKLDGEYKEWYENGRIKLKCNYKRAIGYKPEFNGGYNWWFMNEKVGAKEYIIQQLDGEYKMWYENGQIQKKCNFIKERLEGEYKKWHENGKIKEICNYKNGYIEGEYKEWDENGKIKIICNYKNEVLEGEYKEWDDQGRLNENSNYKRGYLNGNCKKWNYTEGTVSECDYVDFNKEGEYKEVTFDGKIVKYGHYIHDNKHGIFKNLDEKEKLTITEIYNYNKLIFSKLSENIEYNNYRKVINELKHNLTSFYKH
jgi:antitoxin component YwqK of YwqJK toxin-antitoxin module